MPAAVSLTDYFFPLEEQTKSTARGGWLCRKVDGIYKFQQKTGLVSQTLIVVCDVIVLADKIFAQFPKLLGRAAFFSLNALGLMYVDDIARDILKTAIDLGNCLFRLDFIYGFYMLIKLVFKVVDLALLCGICTVSTMNLLGWSGVVAQFYAFARPISFTSFLVGFAVSLIDVKLDKSLLNKIKATGSSGLDGLSNAVSSILFRSAGTEPSSEESLLGNRMIVQLSIFEYRELRIAARNNPNSVKNKLTDFLGRHIWYKTSGLALQVLGYAALAVNKAFPNTIIQSTADTCIASLWWYKSYCAYKESN